MQKKLNIVPLKDLNLTNRFLYDEVMEDPATHQAALSIIFGKEIPLIMTAESEKEFRKTPKIRSIRMDIFSTDVEGTVYNSEMQQKKKSDFAKRSRYYQSLMDSSLLEPGIPDYNSLNESYIITIMSFDPFKYDRYVYTFRAQCVEEPECILADGATRIFLNTRGKNHDDITDELRAFLQYIENTTEEVVKSVDSKYLNAIHERVCKVKANEEVGVKYMQRWEEEYYMREEAMKEGRAEGRVKNLISLVCKKISKGFTALELAEFLEEDIELIQQIYDIAQSFEPDCDVDRIYEKMTEEKKILAPN